MRGGRQLAAVPNSSASRSTRARSGGFNCSSSHGYTAATDFGLKPGVIGGAFSRGARSDRQGDPDGYKSLYSRRPDITLGNPFGGFGRGEAAVFEQLERAASHYRDGETVEFETVSQLVEGDLAYTVEVERFRAKVGGRSDLSDLALRVTCVYWRENGEWKLVHRHADPRVDRQAAESVIQN